MPLAQSNALNIYGLVKDFNLDGSFLSFGRLWPIIDITYGFMKEKLKK